jgi:hypothetical protein
MENEDRLVKTIEHLQDKIDTLKNENFELKRINRDLNTRIGLLLNDNEVVKNVKLEMKDYSDYTQLHNEDTLREFFYLLVLCEKMKYLNNDSIWAIDASELFLDAQSTDLPFYEWQNYIKNRLDNSPYIAEHGGTKHRREANSPSVGTVRSSCSVLEKLKYITPC